MEKDPGNKLGSKWIIGIIEQAIPSRDGKVRKAIVKYQNTSENESRFTTRAARSLVKIFDIDEYVLQEYLAELLNRVNGKEEGGHISTTVSETFCAHTCSCPQN